MKNNITEELKIDISIVKEIICDCCGDKVSGVEDVSMSDIQTQYLSFGYGSKFDTEELEYDVCDDCIVEMFEHFQNNPLDKIK